MRCTAGRWEFGSEFHWMPSTGRSSEAMPWSGGANLYGSGRDALRALLAWGRAMHGPRQLWIPSYYCQDVVASLLIAGVDGAVYRDGPTEVAGEAAVEASSGDVVLRVNYFGLRGVPPVGASAMKDGVEIIEDHTHDPWSEWAWQSEADWCIASLRKTLPIPDGGVLWSPRGHMLPPSAPVTPERVGASAEKLTAMVLKNFYLSGRTVAKESFRRLAVAGESRIALGDVSGMTLWTKNLLSTLPINAWRKTRTTNHRVVTDAFERLDWLSVLPREPGREVCPFSAVLVFKSEALCGFVRRRLIEAQVYPAILWPLNEPILDGVPEDHRGLSRRSLSIACDMRYNEPEMVRVASLIRRSGEEFLESDDISH